MDVQRHIKRMETKGFMNDPTSVNVFSIRNWAVEISVVYLVFLINGRRGASTVQRHLKHDRSHVTTLTETLPSLKIIPTIRHPQLKGSYYLACVQKTINWLYSFLICDDLD